MSRVAVLMSGGVDSAAAAVLLADGGHEVTGLTARIWDPDSGCGDDDGIRRAREVCRATGGRHVVLDLRSEFRRHVVDTFRAGYMKGVTPNPCSVCNREIKFGVLFEAALSTGSNTVATGHYAGLGEYRGTPAIREPAEAAKSQTYFLALVRPGVLSRVRFPLEHVTKEEARGLLRERGLDARASESQDLCFVTSGRYQEFLKGEGGVTEPGPLLDSGGKVVGSHRGHVAYTVGQRLGHDGRRAYVIEKRPDTNEVVVGSRELAMVSKMSVSDANWFVEPEDFERAGIEVKFRYNSPAVPARLSATGGGGFSVETLEPCFAPAPGQVLACYSGGYLLGGGIIAETSP